MLFIFIFYLFLSNMVKSNDITLNGYKKSDVIQSLKTCLLEKCIEPSCYWSAELLCSNYELDVWNILFDFIFENIDHSYRISCFEIWYNRRQLLIYSCKEQHELYNNFFYRRAIVEICTILCIVKHTIQLIHFRNFHIDEFTYTYIKNRCKSDNSNLISDIFQSDDPIELYIPCNELYYQCKQQNEQMVIYWIQWILQYSCICKKKHRPLQISYIHSYIFESKFTLHKKSTKSIIWIIWHILWNIYHQPPYTTELNSNNINKINQFLFYCMELTQTISSKRCLLLFTHSFQLLCVPFESLIINYLQDLLLNKQDIFYIDTAKKNIDLIYNQIL